MRHPPLAPTWIDRPHHEARIGDLPLESGGEIRDCRVTWVEHGEARPGNTVLVLCAIASSHHRLDFLIGPGRALDPARFHVLAIDALGNGLSSSPSNSASQAGADFPPIAIRDMVASQARLLETLGIGELHAVVGASMGGMQALQWAVSHPARMGRVVAMTPMARTARWSQLANELARRALFADEACRHPRPRAEAMRLWVPLAQHLTPTAPRALESIASREAMIEQLQAQQAWFAEHGPDAFDWLAQSRAYDAHDIGDGHGSVSQALSSIRARTLVMAPPLDLYNPEWAAADIARAIPGARFVEIPSLNGHRAASGADAADALFLNRTIGAFLES